MVGLGSCETPKNSVAVYTIFDPMKELGTFVSNVIAALPEKLRAVENDAEYVPALLVPEICMVTA